MVLEKLGLKASQICDESRREKSFCHCMNLSNLALRCLDSGLPYQRVLRAQPAVYKRTLSTQF